MGHRPAEWLLAAADGTDNEDLELYLSGLARYQEWRLAEKPADYLIRLERLLESLAGDLQELERLRGALAVIVEASEDMMPGYGEVWLAYGRLFHALVTVVDGTKWVVAREFPDGVKPQSFNGAFRLLVEAGVLPGEDLAAYESLGRLRNRLAHAWEWQPSATEMLVSLDEVIPPIKDFLYRLRLRYTE